jgi:hypothetical protein
MKWNRILPGAVMAIISLGSAAFAGQIKNMQLYDGTSGSPIVTVSYSNSSATATITEEVYADPQVSSGTTAPIYYCVDLWHDNAIGDTYTITPTSSISYTTSTFSDVDNRIAWLLSQPQATADERGAVQLAIWYTVDNKQTTQFYGFSFTGGDPALNTDYTNLIGFVGYNSAVTYGAQFWSATHDPGNTRYQDLVSAASVPEPGAGLLAAVGLCSALGLRRWHRMGRRAARA